MVQIHQKGPLDLLVCNAAYQEKKGFFETDLALIQRTLDISILANFQIIQTVARKMIAAGRKGRMVICSSGHGTMVFKGTFAYDVSKAALNHFMRCAALELIEHGIRLNAADIGWTHTPGERRWFSEAEQNRLSRSIPIGRAAQADEIAAVIEFLLSDQASYVVGSAGMEHICPNKRILGVNAGHWGAMADFFTCHQRQAFQLDPQVDPAIGLFAEPLAVALHAVNLMSPPKNAILAIVGAGTIGLAILVVLRNVGFESVFIIDKIDDKLKLAREFGAKTINVDRELPAQVIADETSGLRSNGVFEAVGLAQTVRTAYDLCDFGGTIVLIGNLAQEFTLPLQGVTSNETTLQGSYGFNRTEFKEAVHLASEKQALLRRLISGSCSLEETPAVMERMARGELNVLKMVIRGRGGR